jgi:AcrR family transcriptional regulator
VSPGEPQRYADVSRTLLRDVVLRATDRLLGERPWRTITIAQVAAAAGVSRQTVYNEFGNRAELAVAYASWAGDQLLDEVERCVADHADDLRGALVAAFTVFLDVGAEHPLMRSLGAPEGADDLVSTLAAGDANPIIARAVERLSDIITTTWPALPAGDMAALSEVLVRLAISHLLQPSGGSQAAARQVAVVLSPYIAALEEQAGRPGRRG